jgi:hypothetical protein
MDKIHVYETKAKVQDLMSKQQIVASSPSRNQLEKKQIFKQVHASLARAQKIRISHKKFALFTCNFKRT